MILAMGLPARGRMEKRRTKKKREPMRERAAKVKIIDHTRIGSRVFGIV